MSDDKKELTVNDCAKAAFSALLRGDMDERDKYCALLERAFQGKSILPGDTVITVKKDSLQ